MSTAQKLVQARVYAQGLTIAVLIATAAFEISDQRNDQGRYETVQTYDPSDPTHKKMIEKRVHKEEYEGEDQWKGRLQLIITLRAEADFSICRHDCFGGTEVKAEKPRNKRLRGTTSQGIA